MSTREIKFLNYQKVYLDERTKCHGLARGEQNFKCYLLCSMVGYFENYRICHHELKIWTMMRDGTKKEANIIPKEIDENGVLPQLTTLLLSLGIHVHHNGQLDGYQGFKLSINNIGNIKNISSNHRFAWFTNIINQYPIGKAPQDEIKLYETTTSFDLYTMTTTNLLDIDSTTRSSSKIIYPLFNGAFIESLYRPIY